MSPTEHPSDEHQVGITNAQEKNSDVVIAELTKRMNNPFAAGEYGEAAVTAVNIFGRAKTSGKS